MPYWYLETEPVKTLPETLDTEAGFRMPRDCGSDHRRDVSLAPAKRRNGKIREIDTIRTEICFVIILS